MKRLGIFLLSFLCILGSSTPVMAADTQSAVIIETFEDGSYMETIIEEIETPSAYATTHNIAGKKTNNYKDSNGNLLWSVTVTGTFTYDGTTSKCTSATVSTTCPASNWKIASKSASKSGATATATATAKKYLDGVCIYTLTRSVSLTCSKNGTLS